MVVAFQLGQSVKDPLLSNSTEQATEWIVCLGSFEIKVQEAENGHYSASRRAEMFLRTETVFMGLGIVLGWKGTLATESRGCWGVRDPLLWFLSMAESRQTKALLKNPALFQKACEATLKGVFVRQHWGVRVLPPWGLRTTQLEESFIHSPFPGDRLLALTDYTYDLDCLCGVGRAVLNISINGPQWTNAQTSTGRDDGGWWQNPQSWLNTFAPTLHSYSACLGPGAAWLGTAFPPALLLAASICIPSQVKYTLAQPSEYPRGYGDPELYVAAGCRAGNHSYPQRPAPDP